MQRKGAIGLKEARALTIDRQFPSFPSNRNALLSIIERLGYVQIDTISIVERSHHHILWSRMPGYEQAMLNDLLEHEKSIFEYWSTLADDVVRGAARDLLAAEMDVAAGRLEDAGDRLQRARLAGAIGADQGDHLAFVDVEGDAAHRLDAAVGDAESGHLKHRGKPR